MKSHQSLWSRHLILTSKEGSVTIESDPKSWSEYHVLELVTWSFCSVGLSVELENHNNT